MDSTLHVSQAHIDRFLFRTASTPEFQDLRKKLKTDLTLNEAIQEILNTQKAEEILNDCIEYHDFKLKKLVTDSVRYKLTLEIRGGITKIWNYYDLHFVADPEAYDERLQHLEYAQRELEGKPSLIPAENEHKQKELDSEVNKAKTNRTLFLENNKPFSGTAKVSTYNGDKPASYEITFSIPMEMALLVTEKNKELEDNYRVVLNPLIDKDHYRRTEQD